MEEEEEATELTCARLRGFKLFLQVVAEYLQTKFHSVYFKLNFFSRITLLLEKIKK